MPEALPLPGAFGAADPLILLLLAMAVEGYLGGMRLDGLLRPARARLVGVARRLQAKLDRPQRGRRTRVVRGWIVAVALLLPPLALGLAVEPVTRTLPFAVLLELPLVAALVRQRGAWQAAAGVRDALLAGSRQQAEAALARLDPPQAVGSGLPLVARTAEALGARFADAAVAPAMAYLLLGLPGLLAAAALRLLARLYGDDGPFGAGARVLQDILFWPARRLAALLLGLAGVFQPDGEGRAALAAALSGAAPGRVLRLASERARDPVPLARALWLTGLACLLHLGLVAVLLVVRLNVAGL
jgi:adenosylcobinamide-phosphate synthase